MAQVMKAKREENIPVLSGRLVHYLSLFELQEINHFDFIKGTLIFLVDHTNETLGFRRKSDKLAEFSE